MTTRQRSLDRGGNVALTREVPSLRTAVLGVDWDAGGRAELEDALVVATLLVDAQGRVPDDEHVVFLNQLVSPDLTVAQLERARDGDREQVEVDLPDVPPEVAAIRVVLYLDEGDGGPRRTLGQLRRCRIRVLDAAQGAELIRSVDLAPALGPETALVLGELYRHSSGWKFRVVGQGWESGLRGVAADHGLPL